MPVLSYTSLLDVLCGKLDLGWILIEDYGGDGTVFSACAYTPEPEREIVAIAGPLKGSHPQRRLVLQQLYRTLQESSTAPGRSMPGS